MMLINEIGNDADLLTRSDAWLEEERRRRADDLETATNELRAIHLAQSIKQQLQQKNLVAVQRILRNASGEVKRIIIRLMNLPDALTLMKNPKDTLDAINNAGQMQGWHNDGYDLMGSAALRQSTLNN